MFYPIKKKTHTNVVNEEKKICEKKQKERRKTDVTLCDMYDKTIIIARAYDLD